MNAPPPDLERELRRVALIERRIAARRRLPIDVQARLNGSREDERAVESSQTTTPLEALTQPDGLGEEIGEPA